MRAFRGILLTALIWALAVSAGVAGDRPTAPVEQLRALYVQRLVKYVTWPQGEGPEPGGQVIIAATDVGELRPYFNEDSDSPRFRLVQWPADDFHVLVLTGAPEREMAAILKRVVGRPVLTISENRASLRQGAVINFYVNNGKLKLEINPEAASRSGLTISSRLLQLSRIYRGDE